MNGATRFMKNLVSLAGFLVLISTMFAFSLTGRVYAQEAKDIVINKSVRKINSEVFTTKLNDIKDGETIEFMVVVKNVSNHDIPQAKVIDTLPIQMIYISSDLFPDGVSKQKNTTSYLWIVRGLKAGEQKAFHYRVKVDFTSESSGKCFKNTANVAIGTTVKDVSSSNICVIGGDNVLGAITTQPGTAIFGENSIVFSFVLVGLGFLLLLSSRVFTSTRLSSKVRP